MTGAKQPSSIFDEYNFTPDERNVVASFLATAFPTCEDGHWYSRAEDHGPILRSCGAMALSGYALERAVLGKLEIAIRAARKAYRIHPLPVYIFELAQLIEERQGLPSAAHTYLTFLDEQSAFNPTAIEQSALRMRDVAGAISDAQSRLRRAKNENKPGAPNPDLLFCPNPRCECEMEMTARLRRTPLHALACPKCETTLAIDIEAIDDLAEPENVGNQQDTPELGDGFEADELFGPLEAGDWQVGRRCDLCHKNCEVGDTIFIDGPFLTHESCAPAFKERLNEPLGDVPLPRSDAGITEKKSVREEIDELLAAWDESDAKGEGEGRSINSIARRLDGTCEFFYEDSETEEPLEQPDAALLSIMDDCERFNLVDMLAKTHWNQTEAAERFGVSLSTLQEKIKRLNVEMIERSSAADVGAPAEPEGPPLLSVGGGQRNAVGDGVADKPVQIAEGIGELLLIRGSTYYKAIFGNRQTVDLECLHTVQQQICIFYLYLVDRSLFIRFGAEARNTLMDGVRELVARSLECSNPTKQFDKEQFRSRYNQRAMEYAQFEELLSKHRKLDRTFFWVFGKALASFYSLYFPERLSAVAMCAADDFGVILNLLDSVFGQQSYEGRPLSILATKGDAPPSPARWQAATTAEPTLREAFLDSARPDAPAPPLWWIVPVGGMILGIALFAWSPFVGFVVAGLSGGLVLVGIMRAARNRV